LRYRRKERLRCRGDLGKILRRICGKAKVIFKTKAAA
jgi:hypothetical protein